MSNQEAARALFGIAALLESQGANRYRVGAYRRAALSLMTLAHPAEEYLDDKGDLNLPWLGPRLRRKLGELMASGRMAFFDELLASLPRSERELLAVPGVGPRTSQRLVDELGIRSVRGLARAAARGRLRSLRGFGPRREQRLGEAARALIAQAS